MNRLFIVSWILATAITVMGESGECSFYGWAEKSVDTYATACGNEFVPSAMTAAHKTLPCYTKIRVRNLDNGKTVEVTVDDRGPFVPGRIVDLSHAAFGKVEDHNRGLFKCDYEIIGTAKTDFLPINVTKSVYVM